MEHYAAIDVSLEWSRICVVDPSGRIVREAKVRSEREAVVDFFQASGLTFARIGLEEPPRSEREIRRPYRWKRSRIAPSRPRREALRQLRRAAAACRRSVHAATYPK